EMRAHEIERGEIADTLIERGRALQIGEQESQRGDLQPLVDIEIVGLEHVAEGLVRQHPLGGEEWPALAEQMVERIGGDEHGGQGPYAGLIVERKPQRTW